MPQEAAPQDTSPQSAPVVGHMEQPPIDATIPIEELRKTDANGKVLVAKKLELLHDYLQKALAEIVEHGGVVALDGASHFDNWLGSVKRTIAQIK